MAKKQNTKEGTKVLNINLETQTAPKVQEVRGRDWIEYGASEGWNNLYPQFLIDLYYNSSTHAAIINSTADMIAAESIICEDEENKNLELKSFINQANGKESLHDIIKKISLDFKLQGGYALNLIWNAERTKIAEIYHVPVERLRVGLPNELGQIDTYYICSDWSNTRENIPQEVPAFNLNDRTCASQILYSGSYSPSMDIYHTPDYVAGCNWALIDQKVAQFHLSNIENSFSGSYFISFNNGVPTQKERQEIESSIVNKFVGAKAAGKFVLTFSDDKSREPSITPINPPDLDKQYTTLQELLVQNILTSHRVVSPLLFGIRDSSGLGNNANEMSEAYDLYLNSVVAPYQKTILGTLSKILSVNGINYPLAFVQNKPLTNKFGTDVLLENLTQDEIRAELGLEPLITKEKNETTDALNTMSPLIANKVLNNLTLDETRDLVGLQSIDESELPSEEVKMCLGDDGKDRILNTNRLDFKDYIQKYGEEIPEDWELIDEEKVEGEHPDFDFEGELNSLVNTELSKINLEEESELDGVGGRRGFVSGYFRVRYQYAEDTGLVNETGTSRDFCVDLMSSDKIFTKEAIEGMFSENSGLSPSGSGGYDKFEFKGGAYCHHFWQRLIFRTSIGRGMKRDLDDSMLVSTAKARSEGFYPEAIRDEWKAPKTMDNRGSLKNK
tara:strand:- start:2741 stop:4759 length:2019 start_codon:yes stop_codon:yes gene_type:complete